MRFSRVLILLGVLFIFSNCKKKNTANIINSLIKNSKNTSYSKEQRETYLIQAYDLIPQLKNPSIKIKKLNYLAASYHKLNNNKKFEEIKEEILQLAITSKDSINIASSYISKAWLFREKQYDSAYKYYFSAAKIYESLEKNKYRNPKEYVFGYGSSLIDLAQLSTKAKDYNQSEALTIKAIKKFKLSGNLRYLPLSYNNLGTIAKRSYRYDDAIDYYQQTIEYAKKTDMELLYTTSAANNIGTVYKSKGDYKNAEKSYHKGLKHMDFLSSKPKNLARLFDNLGYVKFLADKNNDSVLYLLNKAYKIRKEINDMVGLCTNNLHLAEYYQSKGNDSLARVYAEKAKLGATDNNDNRDLLQAYQLLTQVSTPNEGLKYAQAYIKLSDSITKRDNLYRDKFARIRYESENLQTENEQKTKTISEVQNKNTIYLLGIVLSLTGVGFIIYFFRQRTQYLSQQNKVVAFQTAYETETRISKRLHDELGNDIYQVMLQYQNDPHDPQITNKLNTAYTRARDISRENSEFEIGETYTEELKDMLTNYSKNNIKLILNGIAKIQWETLPSTLKITIYRVLQELMTNMQKHSEADLVAIVFKNEGNNLIIHYSDNGVGIDKGAIQSKNGLRNTEKRIQAIHGTIIFESSKNNGFKAKIRIPI